MKLAVKLALCVVAAGALVLASSGWWLLRAYRTNAEQIIIGSADRITDVIRSAARYQMLKNDREALYHMIRDMGAERGIRRIRIYNKLGDIRFSTESAEVGQVVDKSAEACYACHSQAAPIEKLDRPDRWRIFRAGDGERVLGAILPISNEPDCANAVCHAHPAQQKVLGVIDAQISLQQVDQALARYQTFLIRFTLAALAGLSAVCIALIWFVVYRPVRALAAGTRKVASGDLDHLVNVHSSDELGELAGEFNQMTADLKQARAEVQAFTRNLEDRVDRKTRELEQAHHSLLHSEKLASIGKLAATVAHEVNNPLFGILTNARLGQRALDKVELPAETRQAIASKLTIIERESQRCGDIVKNLLTFSRQAPRQMEPVDVRVAAERSVALIRHQLKLKSIELVFNPGAEAAIVQGDIGQIQQVFVAIMVNAIDAMPQGGRLEIDLVTESADVTIRIRDNGIGIPFDALPRIFEPFFSTKEDQQRTGLGLAIAASIVESHQGHIEVRSTPGQGTEFTILLPLVKEVQPIEAAKA